MALIIFIIIKINIYRAISLKIIDKLLLLKLNITDDGGLLASGEERLAAVGDPPQLGQRAQPVQLAAHLDNKPGEENIKNCGNMSF